MEAPAGLGRGGLKPSLSMEAPAAGLGRSGLKPSLSAWKPLLRGWDAAG